MVTTERPNLEIDRISRTPGRFAMASSTGKVTNCSISSVPRLGAWVITCTWLLVMSGTASSGTLVMLHIPPTIMARVSMLVISLLRIEKSIIELIISRIFLVEQEQYEWVVLQLRKLR